MLSDTDSSSCNVSAVDPSPKPPLVPSIISAVTSPGSGSLILPAETSQQFELPQASSAVAQTRLRLQKAAECLTFSPFSHQEKKQFGASCEDGESEDSHSAQSSNQIWNSGGYSGSSLREREREDAIPEASPSMVAAVKVILQEGEEGCSALSERSTPVCPEAHSEPINRFMLPSNLESEDGGALERYKECMEDVYTWSVRNYIQNRGPQGVWAFGLACCMIAVGVAICVWGLIALDALTAEFQLKTSEEGGGAFLYAFYLFGLLVSVPVTVVGLGLSPRNPLLTWLARFLMLNLCATALLNLMGKTRDLYPTYVWSNTVSLGFILSYVCVIFPGASWMNHGVHLLRCGVILFDWTSDAALGFLAIIRGGGSGAGQFDMALGVCIVALSVLLNVPFFVYILEHNHIRTQPFLSRALTLLLWLTLCGEVSTFVLEWVVTPLQPGGGVEDRTEFAFLITSTVLSILGCLDKGALLFWGTDVLETRGGLGVWAQREMQRAAKEEEEEEEEEALHLAREKKKWKRASERQHTGGGPQGQGQGGPRRTRQDVLRSLQEQVRRSPNGSALFLEEEIDLKNEGLPEVQKGGAENAAVQGGNPRLEDEERDAQTLRGLAEP
uniref:Uncharacterized protein n=1 Tax=Chromera velia CCMP2878 TaxID=1169474 RepID=A0A0G4HNS5_9ALVE|eukprot:Cvel_29614.t1-p1 / transcript=Cvel_29614.t1 / gene=Cvel_29614 / organism=Chromera_velia_CCMP2878 / gene_product=hypothetical protein / transcript_product=hypothetical protein / location=Cvel_scaffold4083:7424-9259(+) / protein_length=612 / sequence_SO=supercontig / SO=protein_coding / is_pseudo=false